MTPTPSPLRRSLPARPGFTLIELLVVISIIAILIGILLPVLVNAMGSAKKVTCSSTLRQLGLVIQSYNIDHKEKYPEARYMPPPFVSTNPEPPLTEVLSGYLEAEAAEANNVYHCPDDDQVFALSGISYDYQFRIGGMTLDDILERTRRMNIDASEVVVMRDFDNGSFVLDDASTIDVPMRHIGRNILFGDGHVGKLELD